MDFWPVVSILNYYARLQTTYDFWQVDKTLWLMRNILCPKRLSTKFLEINGYEIGIEK